MKQLLKALPDLVRLIAKLVRDPLLPRAAKIALAAAMVYLASPAAETINGEVFVVHGGVAAVLDPPRVRSVFRAQTADGMWTLEAVGAAFEMGAPVAAEALFAGRFSRPFKGRRKFFALLAGEL